MAGKKQTVSIQKKPAVQFNVDSVQKSVKIGTVHSQHNIIEIYRNCYTKQYYLPDINYDTCTESEQQSILTKYILFIKGLNHNCDCSITIYNRNIDINKIKEETLYKEVGDLFDELRKELNEINMNRIKEGKNGLRKDKYLTIAVHTSTLKEAISSFHRIDRETKHAFGSFNCNISEVPLNERLEILHDINNMGQEGNFLAKTKIIDEEGRHKEISSFDFNNIRSMGLSINDAISPSSMIIHDDYFELGNIYGCAMQITDVPSQTPDDFLSNLTNVEFNMLFSLNFRPIPTLKANNMISQELSLIRTNIAKEQKQATKGGYSADMINPELIDREAAVLELRDKLRNDEKLFDTVISVCVFAPSLELLESYVENISTIIRSSGFTMEKLAQQQEEGFNAALPLCYNSLKKTRTLTSASIGGFLPFSVMDINDPQGIIYSQNAVSKNLIKYDRLATQNFNGFILGMPGCFIGDTLLRLANGETISFEDMYKSNRTDYSIYSWDIQNKDRVITSARHARITKYTKQLAEVTLEDNTVLRCTPEHLFLTLSGEYIAAEKLCPGTALMPIHQVKNVHLIELEEKIPVYDIESDSPTSIEYENFELGCGIFVHNSGKSFSAKQEMLNVLLGTDADVIVLDPESEYGAMAHLLHGEIIKIAPGSPAHINPMDITSNYNENEGNPIQAKADFILKLCETIIKTPWGLDSIQESIIDDAITSLYADYFNKSEKHRTLEDMPTLQDFQNVLAKRPEKEAKDISKALSLYTTGSLNTFSHHTNVNVQNRFIVYDIKDVGDKMKTMAMLVLLDNIWNRICENRKIGKNTFFYVDEIYLLFQNEISANFLNALFKRARKYGGVPTGLTQNVEDLLESDTARKMLSNCNFVQMLNQAPSDRAELKKLLNLSESQLDFITSAPRGQGLIYTGSATIPFYSVFPKNSKIYSCLTSDMKEIQAYQETERRESIRKRKEERSKALIG